jgi:hypothetical protein
MSEIELDVEFQADFEHTLNGYGVEIYDGNRNEREIALIERMDTPSKQVYCENIDTIEGFYAKLLGITEEEAGKQLIGAIDVRQHLKNEGIKSVGIFNFELLSGDTQRSIAQLMKGLVERKELDIQVGYTSSDKGTVSQANGDLIGRVRSFQVQ